MNDIFPAIELYGGQIERNAKDLNRVVELLARSPTFRTLAEANLERARDVLTEGLATVNAALAQIEQKRKPVRRLVAAE